MAIAARWIRLGASGPRDLQAACAGLATAQDGMLAAMRVPILLWARPDAPLISDLARVEENHFAFALIAPLRLAPGRSSRWRAWALAPALATYRQFGVHAYLDENSICLNGRRIAESRARAVGDCAVVASSFQPEALADWAERDLESAFRGRIEAQYGWEFENAWPSLVERAAIADALAGELADAK